MCNSASFKASNTCAREPLSEETMSESEIWKSPGKEATDGSVNTDDTSVMTRGAELNSLQLFLDYTRVRGLRN